jgi:hypothetical protein
VEKKPKTKLKRLRWQLLSDLEWMRILCANNREFLFPERSALQFTYIKENGEDSEREVAFIETKDGPNGLLVCCEDDKDGKYKHFLLHGMRAVRVLKTSAIRKFLETDDG